MNKREIIAHKNNYFIYILILCSAILLPFSLFSQANLVLNPSFEDDSFCTDFTSDGIWSGCARNWSGASDNNALGYYNICANDTPNYNLDTKVPFHTSLNNFKLPHKGIAFASFGIYGQLGNGASYRGYIQGKLRYNLIAGKSYAIQYYISNYSPDLVDSFCTDNIGFYFSNSHIYYGSTFEVLPLNPQYKNSIGNVLFNLNDWQKIEGSFIASGGERFFSIGNFDDNAHTRIYDCFGNGADTMQYGVLGMYIDDVSVIDTSIIDTVQLCINDSVYLQGAWHKSAGLFYDTIAGMPYQKYLQPVSYASTHTIQYYAGHVGDSFKTAYFWSKIFTLKDTTFNIIMPSIYGCDSVIVCRLVDSNIIGINPNHQYSLEGNLNLQIYPNPSSQFVNIVISSKSNEALKNIKDIKLYVYDLMGKQMKIKPVPKINNEKELSYLLNISEFSSGMYFIKIVDKENRIMGSARFIKE